MALDDVHRKWFTCIDRELELVTTAFREVLQELGHADLLPSIPWHPDFDPSTVNPSDASPVDRELQVLSICFQLLNLAEESAAVEARRFGEEQHGPLYEPGLWGRQLKALLDAGFGPQQVAEVLADVHVEVVLTAHPTEAKRPVVLKQHRALFDSLQQMSQPHWTQREKQAMRERLKTQLERLWRTGEMFLYKPEVSYELASVLDYLRNVFPQAVLTLDQRLRESWSAAELDSQLLRQASLPRLTFGDWVGGDRDGHPFVTAEVTAATLQKLRENAIGLLRERLEGLYSALSLSDIYQSAPPELSTAIEQAVQLLGPRGEALAEAHRREPWRQFVRLMQARLPECEHHYQRPEELAGDLSLLASTLCAVGADRLAESEVYPAQRLVEIFGFHTAALDIRQNSAFYETALTQLLECGGVEATGYAQWDEEQRFQFLSSELQSLRPLASRRAPLGDAAREVLATMEVVAKELETHGPDAIGALIVSMTRGPSDLLAVYIFAREVGLLQPTENGIACPLQVVPLLETGEDLAAGPGIMERFLDHPITRASIAQRPDRAQQVMLGYSDSNKSSGIFASHWRLHMAQYYLAELTRKRDVRLNLFHGRGGTNSRGAGPTHRFMEALASNSLSGSMRLTEQGETIAQKYANAPTAAYNLELLLAATTATTLRHRVPYQANERRVELGERLANYSEEAYRALLEFPDFISFWEQATPIDALEHSFIGSRPARRSGKRTLQDLRAIPWVFSWLQARYYLPAWYGVGYALQRLAREDHAAFDFVAQSARDWPFLRYVLSNVETSMASADAGLMYEYATLVDDAALRDQFYDIISAELSNTQGMINQIFGAPRILRRPRMEATLALRAEGLRELHLRQIQLLRAWRARKSESDAEGANRLLPSLLLSISAIASGLRTTG